MEAPNDNGVCIVQLPIYIRLLPNLFRCTTSTAGTLIIMLITQVADAMRDVINLSTPMLQAY